MNTNKTKGGIVDLFAGCGGMTLGFMNAGFTVAAAFENWKEAADIYRKNFYRVYSL